MRIRSGLLVLAFFYGCSSGWQAADHRVTSDNCELVPPDGWSMRSFENGSVLLTKDGLSLQRIYLECSPVDSGFYFTQRLIVSGQSALEVSEAARDNIASHPGMTRFNLLEDSPVQIDGHEGFRLYYSAGNKEGGEWKGLLYGFVWKGQYYSISYEAVEPYYFERDSTAFEATAQSLSVVR